MTTKSYEVEKNQRHTNIMITAADITLANVSEVANNLQTVSKLIKEAKGVKYKFI